MVHIEFQRKEGGNKSEDAMIKHGGAFSAKWCIEIGLYDEFSVKQLKHVNGIAEYMKYT
jgi:hypothetical protein